jgi:DNA-binding MarR family transcriptional regulator
MANNSDVIVPSAMKETPNAQKLPTASYLRTAVIPRIVETQREDVRGPLHSTLHAMTQTFDHSVAEFDRTVKRTALTDAGRELTAADAYANATAMLAVQADAATKHQREHLAQLETKLSDVPAINEFRAAEIRNLLRGMSRNDREMFISRTEDGEVLAAVLHGPASFPLASADAQKQMLANYNRAHRAQDAALVDDLRSMIDAVENFKDTVARDLRKVLR